MGGRPRSGGPLAFAPEVGHYWREESPHRDFASLHQDVAFPPSWFSVPQTRCSVLWSNLAPPTRIIRKGRRKVAIRPKNPTKLEWTPPFFGINSKLVAKLWFWPAAIRLRLVNCRRQASEVRGTSLKWGTLKRTELLNIKTDLYILYGYKLSTILKILYLCLKKHL